MYSKTVTQPVLRACSSLALAAGLTLANTSAFGVDIMPMGDSITEGFGGCSYRTPLVQALDAIPSCDYTMVGSDSAPINAPAGTCTTTNNDHEGHSGFSTFNFMDIPANSSIPRIRGYLNANTPDVVLLHVGSNDMSNGTGVFEVGVYNSTNNTGTRTIGRIVEMIEEIYASNSNAEIFVSNLIPWFASSTINANTSQLSSVIATMANDRRSDGDAITFVNVRSGYTQSMMQSDLIHPAPAGEQHIANRFLAAMQAEGICDSSGTPPGQATLVSPTSGTASASPQYRWNAESGATNYFLWVNDSTGNRIQQTYTAAQVGCAGGTGTCQVTPSTSMNGGSVFWWIQASNGAGNGPWSTRASFFVGGTPPRATLLQPNGSGSGTNPTYSWNAVSNATWYYIWINEGSDNIIRQWYTAAQAGCASGSGTCSINPAGTSSGARTWWLRTWNPAGLGPWSFPRNFN